MIEEYFADLYGTSGVSEFWGWRCLACGEIMDSAIQANRRRGSLSVVSDESETRETIDPGFDDTRERKSAMKIIHVVGARPNFMKVAPILDALSAYNAGGDGQSIESVLVHTGQHFDHKMSQTFFEELGLPRPDINLGAGGGSHAEQTGRIMIAFEQVLLKERPDLVLVVGDVNSTMACAITAKKLNIAVAHVEAGLRSGDMTMPEEINRKVTDAIADYLFTTDLFADANLRSEGVPAERIFRVGNVMIDTLLKHSARAARSCILDQFGLRRDDRVVPYAVVTLHRPSNVDQPEALRAICEALHDVSDELPIIFPCHPRTQGQIDAFGLGKYFGSDGGWLTMTAPLGYLDFLCLNAHAKVVLTDSGGIQEETTVLGVPCLTMRENTERPITIYQGTNRLIGNSREAIVDGVRAALSAPPPPAGRRPELWDGKAAERIVETLAQIAVQRARRSHIGRVEWQSANSGSSVREALSVGEPA
jgi:UDP-N-acetylglucosamine 2-epimerase (non-hydrolysing)